MKTLLLLSLVSTSLYASKVDSFLQKGVPETAETEVKIGLTQLECTPFNLEKGSQAMSKVHFSDQYYSNCYASGAANFLNSWIMSKANIRDTNSPGLWKSLPDRNMSTSLQVSPHHLALAYAYGIKGRDNPTGRNIDWSKFPTIDKNYKAEFEQLIAKPVKSDEDKKRIDVIVSKRYYYFEDGGGSAPDAINNLADYKVCPIERVEVAFKTESNGQSFFRGMRLIYQDYFNSYVPNDSKVNEAALTKATAATNKLLTQLKMPADAQFTTPELEKAIFTSPNVTDPARYAYQVFMGLCSKSKTHPPVSLKQIFTLETSVNYPKPSSIFNSTGPIFNRELLKVFFAPVSEKGPSAQQMPMAISFAGHAIWKGKSQLAWKWNEDLSKWEHDLRYGGHQSVVVGRRWNLKSSRCEYQIRNTFSVTTAPGWKMDPNGYGIWIRDDYFYRSINWGYFLKDQLGRY